MKYAIMFLFLLKMLFLSPFKRIPPKKNLERKKKIHVVIVDFSFLLNYMLNDISQRLVFGLTRRSKNKKWKLTIKRGKMKWNEMKECALQLVLHSQYTPESVHHSTPRSCLVKSRMTNFETLTSQNICQV